MRWPLQPLQPLQTTQLQPPFGPSVDSLCHPWFTTTHLSYRCPIFETSATAFCGTTGISTVCPIYNHICIYHLYIYIYIIIYYGHVYHNNILAMYITTTKNLKTRRVLGTISGPVISSGATDPPASVRIRRWLVVLRRPLGYDESQKFWKVNHWKSQSILNVDLFDKCVEGW